MVYLSFLVLLAGVLRLGWIRGGYYRQQARDNKVTETLILADRGQIVDRKGRVLVRSQEVDGIKRRQYLYGEALGAVTGYVGKADGNELKYGVCGGKKLNNMSLLGRGGVEESMDCQLLGTDGKKLTEVDAKGRLVRELGTYAAVVGKEVELSIDAYWQEKMYQLLAGKKVAAIVSEVGTGKILVMATSPSFDPNMFAYEPDSVKIKNYLEDVRGLPMLNRSMGAKYHPGSVFKLAVATAGLEEGAINESSTFEDTGVIKVGEYSYSNWLWTKRGTTDGMVDIVKAIKRSNDIFFYRLGETLGSEKIKKWAAKFGLGIKTGVEIPAEIEGLVPDAKWKEKNSGEKWFLGNTYHLSIGQGDVSVSPLQINLETSVIANNGKKCQMSILKNSDNKCESLGISDKTIKLIKAGMVGACSSGGTAWPLYNFKTKLACKTGTAEVGDGTKDTHAWLTAFAPADNPQIVITVLVERGGEGSDIAAPIVGDFLKEWFEEPNTIVPRYPN
ncbi:MAG: Peptidoglycan glycosyltransferase [Microgenomates group bacterium GW2011_GWA2_40_6]|nr:MAG: Peptidoglycan glycosyltransferase [Microgenomates group bacterium GW2011_GWA2_40_6]